MRYLKKFALFELEFLNLSRLADILKFYHVDSKIIKKFRINLVNKPISDAAPGVIQDPAGSAIGSGMPPAGGGASGAIYQKFPDLEPIPDIQPGESVFNSSAGPGKKVLHSFSFHFGNLGLSPESDKDKEEVIQLLIRSYYNTIVAFGEQNAKLEKVDMGILNLVPVSASIYAGEFKNNELNHLDPLYTLAGIYIALDKAYRERKEIPTVNLYYFDPKVYAAAKNILDNAS